MSISAPVKIILIILIPLIIAVIIRLTGNNSGKPSSEGAKAKGDSEKRDHREKQAVKIISAWFLPEKLKEVSGISWIDTGRFACIHDEAGKVFIYNIQTSSIETEIPFAGKGDYEGIAIAGETIYVLQANGEIFEITDYLSSSRGVKLYKTHLTKKQDSESLAYDKKNNRLLIAVKEGKPDDVFKEIFAFDLTTKKMDVKPVYKIPLGHPLFKADKSKKKGIQPSDIAVHPLTGDIYIIEGTDPQLLIMNSKGDLLSLYELKGKEFSQPEGLSFSTDGLMFISNEGDPGNILQVEIDSEGAE